MREIIREALEKQTQPTLKKLILTEFLQHLILQSMYRNNFFENLVFTGGTALRILYRIERFSEDLDFSLVSKEGFRFKTVLEKIEKDLKSQQCDFEFYQKEQRNVAKADLRFPGLLKEFGISPLKDQKLTIKYEIDMKPPAGGKKEISLVSSPVSYTVCVFDLPSLFATKLHAIFYRGYIKGRDYYDLVWYLGRRVKPNFMLLNNAIRQTQGEGFEISEEGLKLRLIEHLKTVDFDKVRSELARFLINSDELKFLDFSLIENQLQRNY